MAGPWEKYGATSQDGGKPWEKYGGDQKPFWADMPRSENVSHAPDQPRASRIEAFTDSVADMATFGAGDEITGALVGAPVGAIKGTISAVRKGDIREIPRGISEEYTFIRDAERADLAKARKDRPVTSVAGSVGGALVNPLSRAGGNFAAGATTRTGATVRAAGVGGLEGAGYGFGSGDGDLQERAQSSAQGAAVGTALGGGATYLLGAASKFFRSRSSQRSMTAAEKQARKWLADTLARDKGGNQNAANATLRTWVSKQNMDPEWLLRNSGPNVRNLMEEAASDNPTPALEFIERMRASTAENVYAGATQAFNPSGGTVKAARDTLKAAREAQAKPLYDAAYEATIPPDVYGQQIAPLLTNQPGRRAIAAAVKLADAEFDTATKEALAAAAGGQTDTLSTKALHYILQGMDDQASKLSRQTGANNMARMVSGQRAQLAEAIKEANPAFAQAQDVWSTSVRMDQALDLGKKFSRPNYTISDLAGDLEGLTKSERDMFRVGLAEQLRTKISSRPEDLNNARWMDTPLFREKLRLLFSDSPDQAEAFIRVVADADDMSGRLVDIDPTSNSATARRMNIRAEGAERASRAAGPSGAAEAFTQNPVSAIPRAITKRIAGSSKDRAAAQMRDKLRQAFFGEGDPLELGAQQIAGPNYVSGSELAAPAAQIPFRQNSE